MLADKRVDHLTKFRVLQRQYNRDATFKSRGLLLCMKDSAVITGKCEDGSLGEGSNGITRFFYERRRSKTMMLEVVGRQTSWSCGRKLMKVHSRDARVTFWIRCFFVAAMSSEISLPSSLGKLQGLDPTLFYGKWCRILKPLLTLLALSFIRPPFHPRLVSIKVN
jgi:hypothetical protein